MRSSILILAALFVLGVRSENISCYSCVSYIDKDCEEVDPVKSAGLIKQCEPIEVQYQSEKLNAIGCRKIVQKVEGEFSTSRECAYTGQDVDGYKKTGNHAVYKIYYQCTNTQPGEPCNTVSGLGYYLTFIAAVISAYFL
ncbi:unnamed protein product [Auanema sp. JU1783]|nr:unnamed protein product [Auanema sp. JU1783]